MEDVQVLEGRWKRFHGFHAFLLELQTPTSVYMETSLIQSIEKSQQKAFVDAQTSHCGRLV